LGGPFPPPSPKNFQKGFLKVKGLGPSGKRFPPVLTLSKERPIVFGVKLKKLIGQLRIAFGSPTPYWLKLA
jgi:hypothetical protein